MKNVVVLPDGQITKIGIDPFVNLCGVDGIL